MSTDAILQVDIWSDYVCPFCYLQLPAIERLAQEFDGRIDIRWRAFELRPEPHPTLDPAGEYLRTTWAKLVYPMAAERRMLLKLPPVQPRSRLAMEAAAFARTEGAYGPMHEALFKAFFVGGRDIGTLEEVVSIGQSVGLDAITLRRALETHVFLDEVLEDQATAEQLGISGVPIMVIRQKDAPWDHAVALRGAVAFDEMRYTVMQLLGEAT